MFKSIFQAWSEQSFTKKVVEDFISMLERSKKMMSYAFDVLLEEKKGKKFNKKIYKKDQKINLTEREIRKQILVHVKANPSCNLAACLGLISIVKDAERLGDYVKNLFELKDLDKDNIDKKATFKKLYDLKGSELLELFEKVETAFRNSDKILAEEAVQEGRDIAKQYNDLIEVIADSEDYTVQEAVAVTLGARYMKRIALHLTNIVSSVTNPFDEIDYGK